MPTGLSPASRLAARSVALALAIACLWLNACSDKAKSPAERAEAAEQELTSAEVGVVARHPITRRLPVSGSLTPLLRTVVKSKVPGEVLGVTVREGMAVKAGEPLMTLDTRGLQARAASADAALQKARADLQIARLNYDNARMLFGKKVLAQNELDTKRSVFEAAQAAVRVYEAELRVAQITLEDAAVTAPFDAVVARRFVDPGGKVSPDTQLFELVDLAHMEFQAAAPAAEIPALRSGQIAEVRVDGFGDRLFQARLERINPTAEQGSRLILIYFSIDNDNSEGQLRGGMFAQGDVMIEQVEAVPAIPESAIINDSGITYVMVIKDGHVERQRVELGIRSARDRLVEVRDGLTEGARILTVSMPSLESGNAVRVVDAGRAD